MGFESINEISIVLMVCTVMAVLFIKLKQPPILGYIITGIMLGPYTLQCIKNTEVIRAIGDYGILIMLFTVGLKLNVHEFKKVWKSAVTCVLIQILFGVLISIGISYLTNLDKAAIALMTCMIALSSTAVAIRVLENSNEMNTAVGSIVISILIAQDLALAPMVMILKNFVFNDSIFNLFFKMFISIISIIAAVSFLSKGNLRVIHRLFNSSIFKISEINALISVTACFSCAALSEHLGLSGVYGAFLCGFVLGNIGPKNLLLSFSTPLSGMLMMSFFLYIGILFDVQFIMQNIFQILLIVFSITILKVMLNAQSLRLLGWKKQLSFESSILLSQISEFAFILVNIYSASPNATPYFINWVISTTVISLSIGAIFTVTVKSIMDKS